MAEASTNVIESLFQDACGDASDTFCVTNTFVTAPLHALFIMFLP